MYIDYNDMLPYDLQIYFEKSNCKKQIHSLSKNLYIKLKNNIVYLTVVLNFGILQMTT